MKISTGQAQVIIGLAGLALAYYALKKTGDTVKDAANAINPTNNNNVINQGVNSVLGLDNKTESIGTKIYDWTHKPATNQVKPAQPQKTVLTPGPGMRRKSSNPRTSDYYVFVAV